jgi:hypothetical protein
LLIPLATTVVHILRDGVGAWAAMMAVNGGLSGFVAMVIGRSRQAIIDEAQLGAVGAWPAGAMLFVASVINDVFF